MIETNNYPVKENSLQNTSCLDSLESTGCSAICCVGVQCLMNCSALHENTAHFKHAVRTSDQEGTQYNFAQISLNTLNILDIFSSSSVTLNSMIPISLPLEMISQFVLPVGGSCLLLKTCINVYQIAISHILQKDPIFQKNGEKDPAFLNNLKRFLKNSLEVSEKEWEKLSPVKSQTAKKALELTQFRALSRRTSNRIAGQFEQLSKEIREGNFSTERAAKVLSNAKILHRRKTLMKVTEIAFSVLTVVAVACILWQPVALGLALLSIALLARLFLTIYEGIFLEKDLTLKPAPLNTSGISFNSTVQEMV